MEQKRRYAGWRPTRGEEHEPIQLELTEEQKEQILKYMQDTGRQVEVSLIVDVVEGKIAPAAVSVGAA
jgi:hypothetical protein